MSTSAQTILPLAFMNKALGAAIFAVSTMYLGKLRGDAKLRSLAMAAYPSALSLFHSELFLVFGSKAGRTYQKISAVATALSLLFFEVSSPEANFLAADERFT